ncbi:YheC/YheD family endospore coat-associated protein [Paenibacillus tyrfis]|uniref:YheC/YheD family endospore coat-associated protein n=1 Tax=Paenibacillus tyrfis TaxID=1501230 RepID=UPI00209DD78F|nr:YheC/YheD family protein [Paenibacillus tyrfis]MCP1306193.1 YheC/YheD family protein [Paenibacillus tyrfis]
MNPQLGVLAMYMPGRKLEELSFYRKLSIYGQKLGVDVFVFTPDDVDDNRTRIHALAYNQATRSWTRRWVGFPPIVYDRCRYHGADNYRKITNFRQKYTKLRYLSRPLANKWIIHRLLSENENIAPHLPSTVHYKSRKQLEQFLKKHPIVYMKPKSGTGGRGIVRLQRLRGSSGYLMQGRDANRRILPATKVTAAQIPARLAGWGLQSKYIVQQGIPLELKDGRVHDFRMLVQKDGQGMWQVTGCAGRIGPPFSVTSNLHGGGTAISMETMLKNRFRTEETVKSIKETAYTLGIHVAQHLEAKFGTFCEAGIDLAVDPSGHVWLLEVNPKPSRDVFRLTGDLQTYRRAIRRPIEFALHLLEKKAAPKTDTNHLDLVPRSQPSESYQDRSV